MEDKSETNTKNQICNGALSQTSSDNQKNVQEEIHALISQAKQLLKQGRTSEAESVIKAEIAHFPENEEILQQLYSIHKKRNEWQAAKHIAEKLVEINPQKATYYFQLGRTCAFLKEAAPAKEAYISGLQKQHNLSFADVIAEVTQDFTYFPVPFTSDYLYIKGKNNYGALFHSAGEKQYVTKIAKYNHNAKREEVFFRDVCSQFPQLQNIVPDYINSREMDRLLYLTTVWVRGDENIAPEPDEIIEISQLIASVPYFKMLYAYGNPSYTFQYRNRPTFIIQFFTEIHHKETNEKLFTELYKLVEEKRYPQAIQEVIQRLEKQIMPYYLYAYIDPEVHYALLHGDFHPGNFKRSSEDGKLYVFDWASFTTGPHFLDIARYMSKSLFSFQEVKELYIDCEQTGGNLSIIEKIFFLYALILLYILRLREKAVADYLVSCILPAIEELERLVKQFTEESLETWMLHLRDTKNEHQQEILRLADKTTQLAEQKKRMTKKAQKLEKQNKQMKKSTSWKVTKPFRKLMAKWRK